uniref:Uncharacterized protein n=1 Tax=Lygus hesperus TaxID=30085 RepID=A0A0A9YQ58_LYGHE
MLSTSNTAQPAVRNSVVVPPPPSGSILQKQSSFTRGRINSSLTANMLHGNNTNNTSNNNNSGNGGNSAVTNTSSSFTSQVPASVVTLPSKQSATLAQPVQHQQKQQQQ